MRGPLTPIARVLIAGHIVALGLLLLAAVWPLPRADTRLMDGAVSNLEADAPKASAHDIDQILDRPIFHTQRRKPSVVRETAKPVKAPRAVRMPFQLMGVLVGNAGHTAYLFDQDKQETIAVKSGSQAGAWRVLEVSDSQVTLEADNAVRTLKMADGG